MALTFPVFLSLLYSLPWMDNITRKAALLKLSQVIRRVGRKADPSTYPGYDVVPGQYYTSILSKNAYDFAAAVGTLDQTPNPDAWEMTADTVNAYYEPTSNSINFPAGILQSPFFSIDRLLAQNYGGIGMVMGHELTHGFDDQVRIGSVKGVMVFIAVYSTPLISFLRFTLCALLLPTTKIMNNNNRVVSTTAMGS